MEPVDELFVFLAEGAEPAGQRVELETGHGRTALVWVPDAATAAGVVGEQVRAGARLVELYRGFDLAAAGQVIEAAADLAPVGVSGTRPAEAAAAASSATIFLSDPDDPGVRRVDLRTGAQQTAVIPVAGADEAIQAALDAVREGATLLEICGGTPLTVAARIRAAVAAEVTVAVVSWPFESITGAAAYKAAFEAAQVDS